MTYHRRRASLHTRLARLALAAAFLLMGAALVVAFGIAAARAHGQYQWVMSNPYTAYCCTPRDCRPISESTIIDDDPQFTYRPTGQKFTRGSTGLENSPDERWHACFYEGTDQARCLFVPRRAY